MADLLINDLRLCELVKMASTIISLSIHRTGRLNFLVNLDEDYEDEEIQIHSRRNVRTSAQVLEGYGSFYAFCIR